MTLDELAAYEDIRRTLATYNHAGDSDDAEAYAGTFTENAIFENPGYFHHVGRAQILEWKKSHQVFTTARFRMHNLSSVLIDLTGSDSADVRSYWIAITNVGPDHAGKYIDKLVRTDVGWKIANRLVEMDWISDSSKLEKK